MILKEDAKIIADAKKSAYIMEKVLEFTPLYFNSIREAANNMKYDTVFYISKIEFIPEILEELAKVMQEKGYKTHIHLWDNKDGSLKVIWTE